MARALTSQEKMLVTVMAFLAAGGVLYQFVLKPTMLKRTDLEKRVQTLQQQTTEIRAQLRDLQQLEQQYKQVQSELAEFQELIPDKKEIPGLLKQIELMALQCNVDVPSISTAQPINKGQYQAISLTLSAEGTFQDIMRFFGRLATAPRLITVQHADFGSYDGAKGGEMQVSIGGSIYIRGGAPSGATQQPAQQP